MKTFPLILMLFFYMVPDGKHKGKHKKQNTDPLTAAFEDTSVSNTYKQQTFMDNTNLEADFNGDGYTDVATQVKLKQDGKKGIMIVHGNTGDVQIFGAGYDFGSDFNWASHWEVYSEKQVEIAKYDHTDGHKTGTVTVSLSNPCIFLTSSDSSLSGYVYWNGSQYAWLFKGN
jgi:hypothetical protein